MPAVRNATIPSRGHEYIVPLLTLPYFLTCLNRGPQFPAASASSAELALQFSGRQLALAKETPQEISGVAFSFLRIAFQATRNQVPVGIGPICACGTRWSRHLPSGVTRRKQEKQRPPART